MTTVTSDRELHEAINRGTTEVEAVAGEGFELLRTLGLARPPFGSEPERRTLDLIEVEATGLDRYLAANAVLAGLWAGHWQWRRHGLTARMGARHLETRATSLAVCNGQFAAPARWIAPRAHPSDGRLAVLIDGNRPLSARALARRMELGDHVPNRLIRQLRPETLEVDGPTWCLEADGIKERGRLPARFAILPGALTLLA